MYKINNELLEAIGKIEGKGEPVITAGPTGSGKSASIAASASHPVAQILLGSREASGKGSVTKVNTIATDYEMIPEDKLIMLAELHPKTLAECGDDNELLGNVLYSGAKLYHNNQNEDLYKDKLYETLKNLLSHPSNDSLAYKLKDIGDDKYNEIMKVILKFDISQVTLIYDEMIAKTKKLKKGQRSIQIFIELLSSRESFREIVKDFWDLVTTFINDEAKKFRHKLKCNGAVIEKNSKGGYRFTALLGENDIDSELAKILLKSEEGSKEYLFSNVSLIYRGADYIFDVENKDALTVAEIGDKKIHCIRIIDTQGLFHSTNVTVRDESERIVDLLSEFHSTKLLLVISSFVTDTVKDSYAAISTMLHEVNRDIEIYVLFTHWDEYLKSFSNQIGTVNRFTSRITVDWHKKYKEALYAQKEVVNRFNTVINDNTSKKKPKIINVYRAAILSDAENKMEDFLYDEGIQYPNALKLLFTDMAKQIAITKNKYRVIESLEESVSIEPSQFGKQNISSLYSNLVNDCKNLKLYASTVRACNRKWISAGNVHSSNVRANVYGFQNITTTFIREIRNYAMKYVKKLDIDAKAYLPNREDDEKFITDLMTYLTAQQNVGREVAKIIGNESYYEGFIHTKEFKYQYEYFTDMIQYVQDNYFISDTIYFTEKFEKCLIEATQKCIRNFIDSKCIVVY